MRHVGRGVGVRFSGVPRSGVQRPRTGALTYHEMQALRIYARVNNYDLAARGLGITYGSFKARMIRAFAKLGVTTAIEAYTKLGWLRVPPYEQRPE